MQHFLYLMRHAHIETEAEMIGKLDLPLSNLGIEQAEFWKEQFVDVKFSAMYASPLKRAKQSAKIICNNSELNIIEEFSEISLGLFENKKKEEILEKYSKEWEERGKDFYYNKPPLGESFYELEKRVMPAFYKLIKDLQEKNKDKKQDIHTLIVAHQAINRIILAQILSVPKKEIMQINQGYACINIFEISKNIRYIKRKDCPIQ